MIIIVQTDFSGILVPLCPFQDNSLRTNTALKTALNQPKIETTVKPHTNLNLKTNKGFSVFLKRNRKTVLSPDTLAIKQDPAFNKYVEYLKIRGQNNGRVSKTFVGHSARGVIHFLQYCNLEITDHALSDLVKYKRQNPNSSEIEEALRSFANLEPRIARTRDASNILGVFNKGNFTRLELHLNTHPFSERIEIPEVTLKQIFAGTAEEDQILQSLSAFIGERIYAIANIKAEDINFDLDNELATIFFDGSTTKNHIRHFSLCPKPTIYKALEIMKDTHRERAFPNYDKIWREISKFAKSKFTLKYTSHYLRARFETLADDTGISMNKVNYLMGGAPHGSDDTARLGHLPKIYIMKQVPKFAEAYKQHLLKPLSLASAQASLAHWGDKSEPVFLPNLSFPTKSLRDAMFTL